MKTHNLGLADIDMRTHQPAVVLPLKRIRVRWSFYLHIQSLYPHKKQILILSCFFKSLTKAFLNVSGGCADGPKRDQGGTACGQRCLRQRLRVGWQTDGQRTIIVVVYIVNDWNFYESEQVRTMCFTLNVNTVGHVYEVGGEMMRVISWIGFSRKPPDHCLVELHSM